MARRFSQAGNDSITLSLGNLGFAFGPGSIMSVFRLTTLPGAGLYPFIFSAGNVLTVGYGMYVHGDTNTLNSNLNDTDGRGPAVVAGRWYFGGFTKISGTANTRFHSFDYSTGVWSHQDQSGIGAQANSSVPTTKNTIGRPADNTWTWPGDIAIVGVWDVVLTDAQCESLSDDLTVTNWNGWTKARGLWIPPLNPATSLVDLSGGGANQSAITGTTATPDDFPLLLPTAEQSVTGSWS